MVRFTLLEVNLDSAEFTANAPFSSDSATESAEETVEEALGEEAASGTGTSSVGGILLGLVALIGVAAVAKKLMSRRGGESTEEEMDVPLAAR